MTDRRQADFDKVWCHYFVKGHTHGTSAGLPAYRGKNGARCAVGVLITDEDARHLGSYSVGKRLCDWDPETRKWVPKPYADMPVFVPEFIRRDPMFYVALQDAHDSTVGSMEAFRFALENFAKTYDLLIPE